MTSLIRYVVDRYNDGVENNRAPWVHNWPLMGSPVTMLSILGLYLLFVKKIGPKIMEKRPAFELNTLMLIYNAVQVIYSIWLTLQIFDINFRSLIIAPECDSSLSPSMLSEHVELSISMGAWWYLFAKIMELMDTVFFVLRKKEKQISFLHVYHHTTAALLSWCTTKFMFNEHGAIIALLNTIVHVIMYFYYFISALGPKYKKYTWWKKQMTFIQLVQFGLMLTYLGSQYILDCRPIPLVTHVYTIDIIILLYLFTNFYIETYNKKKVA